MSEITPEQRADLRLKAEDATGDFWVAVPSEGQIDIWAQDEQALIANVGADEDAAYIVACSPDQVTALLEALDAAGAQRTDVLAFLRLPQLLLMPGSGPVAHSEGCWAWHTPCLATKIRRMLGDEP